MTQETAGFAEFGAWVRRVRQRLALSRRELARVAGIAESTVRNVETRRHRTSRTTAALIVGAIARWDQALAAHAPALGYDPAGPAAGSGEGSPIGKVHLQRCGAQLLVRLELDLAAVSQLPGLSSDPLSPIRELPDCHREGVTLCLILPRLIQLSR